VALDIFLPLLSNALNLMPNSIMSKGMIWRRTAVPVYCIANVGAFHGTNQSWIGDVRRPGHDVIIRMPATVSGLETKRERSYIEGQ
jgi:hypothetical protein